MPTVMITGANRGIGLEFAKQYAQEGWTVVACCRNPSIAEQLSELATERPNISVYALDVKDERSVKTLKQELGNSPIDVLINNAGVYLDRKSGFGSLFSDDWLTTMDINVVAPFRVTQTFIDNVLASQQKKIVMISSQMGSIKDNMSGASYMYRSSKSALNSASRSLAIDLKPEGVTVMIVHPGWVLTDMGGPNALLTTQQSIEGMRNVIAESTVESTGKFLAYDGRELPW